MVKIFAKQKKSKKKFNNEDYYLLRPIKNKSLKISATISDKDGKIRDLITKKRDRSFNQ